MKKKIIAIISLILVINLLMTSVTTSFAKSTYSDMPSKNHSSYEALKKAIDNGLYKGSKGKINPKGYVSRVQLAAIISRAFGATETADLSMYKDAPSNANDAKYMARAVQMGIFQDNAKNKLNPSAKVTRQEACCILARVFNITGGTSKSLKKYKDKDKIEPAAKEAMASMVEAGYIKGSKGKLNPKGKITRAQLAQIMSNLVSQYISKSGTYTTLDRGNIMINTTDVTLKDTVIKGDLIIGDGAGNSDITLDNVMISGHLLVRGGGGNSIKIINGSSVGSIIVTKTAFGPVHIKIEEGCSVNIAYISDGNDDVIVEGTYNQVVISTQTPVILKNAKIDLVSVSTEGANIKIDENSVVQVADIPENASNTK